LDLTYIYITSHAVALRAQPPLAGPVPPHALGAQAALAFSANAVHAVVPYKNQGHGAYLACHGFRLAVNRFVDGH